MDNQPILARTNRPADWSERRTYRTSTWHTSTHSSAKQNPEHQRLVEVRSNTYSHTFFTTATRAPDSMSNIPATYDGYRLPKQGSLDCLEFRKGQTTPQPEPYQCLIKVHAASLNVGIHSRSRPQTKRLSYPQRKQYRDFVAVIGKYPQPPKADVRSLSRRFLEHAMTWAFCRSFLAPMAPERLSPSATR